MHLRRLFSISGVTAGVLALSGCQRALSVDVAGSFFPIWIFCIVAGVGLAALARFIFVRARMDTELGPALVIYPSMAALFAFSIWLIFFRY